MRDVPVPLVIGVDLASTSPVAAVYNTTDTKIMRIGPMHRDLMVAVFAVPKGLGTGSYSPDNMLCLGTVDDRRRVTLFGDPQHYFGQEIIIRVRGKSEVTGQHIMPFETAIDGDKIAQAAIDRNAQKKGMVGTIVRTQIREDFLLTGDPEDQSDGEQMHADIVGANSGVGVDDYAALGKFIVEFRNGRN